ncbi:MAG: ABC transporter permease [Spirochaetales bacterium]|nr:ABC transporter permease [Spirochaetales bacterium]
MDILKKSFTGKFIAIISVIFGVMIVTICFNVITKISSLTAKKNNNQIVCVKSGKMEDEYNYNSDDLPVTNDYISENIVNDIKEVTFFNMIKWVSPTIIYNEDAYSVTNAIAAKSDFITGYNLELLEGSNFMDGSDSNEMLISDSLAEILGSGESLLGKTIDIEIDRWEEKEEKLYTTYTIIGVYKSPKNLVKVQKGIPEVIVSYNSESREPYMNLLVNSENIEKFKYKLEDYLKNELGDERDFIIWTGNIMQIWNDLEWLDEVVTMIKVFFYILGGVTLVITGFSVFSMVMISVTERNREVGLKRALGCTKIDIIKMFFVESSITILVGIIPGVFIASLFFPTVLDGTLNSLTGGMFDLSEMVTYRLDPLSVLIASGVTLISGAVFGIFPSLSSVNAMPIEAIKDN